MLQIVIGVGGALTAAGLAWVGAEWPAVSPQGRWLLWVVAALVGYGWTAATSGNSLRERLVFCGLLISGLTVAWLTGRRETWDYGPAVVLGALSMRTTFSGSKT